MNTCTIVYDEVIQTNIIGSHYLFIYYNGVVCKSSEIVIYLITSFSIFIDISICNGIITFEEKVNDYNWTMPAIVIIIYVESSIFYNSCTQYKSYH